MSQGIDRITIKGYKSIRSLESFELRRVNVLIGANGAGKSNFVGFFRFLQNLIHQRLQLEVAKQGGADACLFMGSKITQELSAVLRAWGAEYEFSITPTVDDHFVFANEKGTFGTILTIPSGHAESGLKKLDYVADSFRIYQSIAKSIAYHFNDTSTFAGVRRVRAINDNEYLREDGANLAPYLCRIRQTHPVEYNRICDAVRLAAPFFDDFKLRPVPTTPDNIQLEWLQQDSDYPFRANQMSDGTLRFVCLATALLQPDKPATMLFDEPELGLHPYALSLLGALFHEAAHESQLIISTQSPSLLNEFEPEDIVVVERCNSESVFRRLSSTELSEWLEDYGLGELWQKNVLGGRPAPERLTVPEPKS